MRHQKGPEERYVINFDKLTTESTFSVSFKVGGFKRNLDSCRSKRRRHETLVDQSLFYYNNQTSYKESLRLTDCVKPRFWLDLV